MTTEREALERALDLFNGNGYGKNASNETIAKRWLEWEKQARAALAATSAEPVGAPQIQRLRAAQPPAVAPVWYAVVSKRAPVIDRAIRREDVANEYANKCRADWPGVEVVPLYAAPLQQEGWVSVPMVPTQAMCIAGQDKAREWPKFPLRISPIYQAMLAAAPSQGEGAPNA